MMFCLSNLEAHNLNVFHGSCKMAPCRNFETENPMDQFKIIIMWMRPSNVNI